MSNIDEILAQPGPFASLTMPIDSSVEDATDRMTARWGNVRREFERQGAGDAVLDLVEETVLDLTDSGAEGVAIVATEGAPVVAQLIDEAPADPTVRWSAVPSLVPVLRWHAADIPHLVVVTDREGADIWVRSSRGEHPEGPHAEVEGDTANIARSHPGGWSQRRFQQRAENTWERNAAGVAEEIHQIAARVGAQLIVATGDVRAIGFLEEHLPHASKELLHVVESGGRSDPDVLERISGEADHLVSDLVARRVVDALERFAVARGHDLAVEGAEDTLLALSESRVALLLVHDDPEDDRTGWSAPGGLPAAAERSGVTDLGLEPIEGRLVDVAVRAALATGAEICVVPAHGPNVPAGHVGGVLRG